MQFHTFHGITSFFFQTASRIIKEKKFQETATSLFQDLGVSTKSVRSVIDLVSSAANIILEAVGHVYGSLPLHFVLGITPFLTLVVDFGIVSHKMRCLWYFQVTKLKKLELSDVNCNCTSLCVHLNTRSRMFASSSFKELYVAKYLGNRKRWGGSTNHIRSILSPLIFLTTLPMQD